MVWIDPGVERFSGLPGGSLSASPQICIVGAGAVGLVYARFLRRAGAEVALLVKPEHAESCGKGFTLHRLGRGGRCDSERIDDLPVYTSVDELAEREFDQIWITVASDAMRNPWLGEVLDPSQDATVVMLQPDLEDRALALEHVAEDRLVQGLIGFLSFQSPLPKSPPLPEGIAYQLLPGMASGFDGARASEIVSLLKRGGFPARQTHDLTGRSAERSATTVPLIAGLEAASWSMAAFVSGPWLPRSIDASKEALAVVAKHLGRRPAPVRRILSPLPVRAALALARPLTPFDLEAYLCFHFTKVGPQTRLMLETYARLAEKFALESTALHALRLAL
jgi:2-dehydropantoate 2-reductase